MQSKKKIMLAILAYTQKRIEVSIAKLPAAFALAFEDVSTPISIHRPDTVRLNKISKIKNFS